MNEDFIALVHCERKQIDGCIKSVDALKTYTNGLAGRELALTYTKLQEAKMWLGKALEVAGSELPQEYRDEANEPSDEVDPDPQPVEAQGNYADMDTPVEDKE
jgi:hypothetical protein